MSKPLDRDRLCKLLGLLGSDQDGEVLNAARHVDAMIRAAGTTWAELISPGTTPATAKSNDDLVRLDQLIQSEKVSDILKMRLSDMREAARRGRLSDADRKLLRILHRKAVIDGVVVDA